MKTLKRWIRRKLRELLAIDAELTQIRQEVARVRELVPRPEIRRKYHDV